MPWIRLSDNYLEDEKINALSNGAFRLWHEGMAYARRNLTDGLVPFRIMRGFKSFTKRREKELALSYRDGLKPLWELIPATGYKIHNYLEWNLSKEDELAQQALNKHRSAFYRDKGLRQRLRERDGDMCRYCGVLVNWADRKGKTGATYDHIDPKGSMEDSNLVIACRSCNSSKRDRTPEDAGLVLRPVPIQNGSRSDLSRIRDSTGMDRNKSNSEKEKEDPFVNERTTDRAGAFIERYQALYQQYRKGALYAVKPMRDYAAAVTLCHTWQDDARLDKLAIIFLTTDHKFAEEGSRTVPQFLALSSWCDSRLCDYEAKKASA